MLLAGLQGILRLAAETESCCAPQGLDRKQQLTYALLKQKGSLPAARQGLRSRLGKKANMITTERRAREGGANPGFEIQPQIVVSAY